MSGYRLTLLGGFALNAPDGAAIKLGTRKAEALLAVLAVDARPMGRDRIAALLWPDSGEAQARASLRQALALVRKALGPDGERLLRADANTLGLDPHGMAIDVTELVALAGRDQAEDLARVLTLYRGDFLQGFSLPEEPFEDWCRHTRAHLRTQAIAALDRLLARRVDAGDDAGLDVAERLLAIEPTSEVAFRATMRLHAAAGRMDKALLAYERCATVLRESLGIAPSPQTEQLFHELRARAQPGLRRDGDEARTTSIAVLPFTSSDADGPDPLARGLRDDLVIELARFRNVRVLAGEDPGAAAAYVLRGSVRRSGDKARVTVQLLDQAHEQLVWGDRFDLDARDAFTVQDEITRRIAGELSQQLDERRLAHARRAGGQALSAYDLWLSGLSWLKQGTPQGDSEARQLFQRALATDPLFARAYTGLSLSHFNEWSCQAWHKWDETQRQAFDYASRAVELDDADALAQCILGKILLYRRELDRAEKHLDRALALNPNDPDNLAHVGIAKTQLGHAELGLELARTAAKLNPRHPDWYLGCQALPLFLLRRWSEAVAAAERAPDAHVDTRALLASAYALLGADDRAELHRQQFLATFQQKILFGKPPSPGEPARWVLHVNPMRRSEDTALLTEGLQRAGLPLDAEPHG